MTVKLQLDTAALTSLIEKDPAFELQIQQAVIENISKRFVKNKGEEITNVIKAAVATEALNMKCKISEEYGTYRAYGYNSGFEISANYKAAIVKAVRDTVGSEMSLIVGQAVSELSKKADERIAHALKQTEERVNSEIANHAEAFIKVKVEEKIQERYDAFLKG